jgi:hypothetical protein
MERVASMDKKADPYTMNQEHANNPIEKYHTGDPSTWGEEPDMKTPWKGEGRTEDGHPAPARGAREAVVAARTLEEKALKCITIAQRMLPGAVDGLIEEQATDLMYMPEHSVLATLQRQSKLAEILAKSEDEEDADAEAAKKKDEDEDADAEAAKKKDEDEADAEAAKKKMPEEKEVVSKKKAPKEEEEVEAGKKKEEEEVEAGKKKEEEEVEAAKAPKKEEEEVEAAKAPKKEEEEVEAAKKKDEDADAEAAKKKDEEEVEAGKKKEEEEVEAKSNGDLLDLIFAQEEPKTGAKKLSGIVKQASTESNLDNLWDAPPDVSKAFR